jgi:SAM-dependent methyltransferase
LVYDRRRFPIDLPGRERVDFWACDATCLPFADAQADIVVGLNLLDCVPDPPALLQSLAQILRPGGTALLSTPYDWSTRATQPESWIGGHSQRAPHHGAAEPILRHMLNATGWEILAEQPDHPWHTRLHDRSIVHYTAHLLAAARPHA